MSGSVELFVLPELKNIIRLDLSSNKISGLIPKWLWNSGEYTLAYLNLSHNLLEGFNHSTGILPWSSIRFLDLQSTLLQGSVPLPLPSPQTVFCSVANNKLSGVLPASICNMSFLQLLDLSNNNFSGLIPSCFGNFSSFLTVLNLRRNHFQGTPPETFASGSILRTLDVSDNQLQGLVPRSLAQCKNLEVLNLGKNNIRDSFPLWLGILPKLQVLILRSNKFYGLVAPPKRTSVFKKLNIIDVSCNEFTGSMPSNLFKSFKSMAMVRDTKSPIEYIRDENNYFFDSVTVISKGLEMELVRILTIFKAIDFSNNKFEGEIPKSIGNLKSLCVLNFSGNGLTVSIPSVLGNLRELQSLDLSRNTLSGVIPWQLTSLTFLSVFDVSQNHLEGSIPHGTQFETFANTLYEGNSDLCGFPLPKNCGNGEKAPSPPSQSEERQSSNKFIKDFYDWIVVLMGYGCGLVIGVVGGHNAKNSRTATFGIGQHR